MRTGRKEKPEHFFPPPSVSVGIYGGDSGLICALGITIGGCLAGSLIHPFCDPILHWMSLALVLAPPHWFQVLSSRNTFSPLSLVFPAVVYH